MASTKPRARRAHREPSPTTPDPIEIAMEAEAGASPDRPARGLLIEQLQLIRTQTKLGRWRRGLSA